jgi:hypothetical protein
MTRRKDAPSHTAREVFAQTAVPQTVATHEAAAMLGRANQTLRKWACLGSGPLRPIRLHGRLRWRLDDIRALLSGA